MRVEIPQPEIEDESDYQRWLFEVQREAEQQQEGGSSDE